MTLQFFNKIFNLGGTSTVPLDFGGFKLGVTTAVKKVLEFFGYPLNLTNIPTATTLAGYKVYGNTEQDGTPTPENPIEVQSVGEKTKNLLDIKYFFDNYQTYSSSSVGRLPIKLKPNTNYTVSTDIPNAVSAQCFIVRGNNIAFTPSTSINGVVISTPVTVETDSDGYLTIGIYYTNTSLKEQLQDGTNYIQLEEGSTATTYEPYGYKVPVKIEGKNLFNINSSDVFFSKNINESGVETTSSINSATYFIPVESDSNYVVSFIGIYNGSITRYHVYNENKEWIKQLSSVTLSSADIGKKITIPLSVPSNGKYIRFTFSGTSLADTRLEKDIQLERGSIATNYQAYLEPNTANIYLSEPLRKLGDYADYIDYENQEVVRNIVKDNITKYNPQKADGYSHIFRFSANKKQQNINPVANSYNSTRFEVAASISTMTIDGYYIKGHPTTPLCYISDSYHTTQEEFDNFIKTVDDTFYYPLATPTTEKITLPDIAIPKGDSVITTDTEIKPSDMYGKVIV